MGNSRGAFREFRETCFPIFRYHIPDWIAIVALAILEGILLLVIHPFRRLVSEYTINDMRLPVKSFTVPLPALVVISIIIPMLTIIGYYLYKRDPHDLHHGLLGLFLAVLISGALTDTLKNVTGRPRPDFFWRCFPDGIPHYTNDLYREVICTGKPSEVRQGYKSFPSGHASWSFSGLGYMTLYLAGKTRVFNQRGGRVIKLLIVAIPLVSATLVAISIIDDYWHHGDDTIAGAILGLGIAILCYRTYFPSLCDNNCSTPYPLRNVRNPSSDMELGNGREEATTPVSVPLSKLENQQQT